MKRAGLLLLLLAGCDPVARQSDVQPSRDIASDAQLKSLHNTDEIAALRRRVEFLEQEQKFTTDWVKNLAEQNVTDEKQIKEMGRAYDAHLENHRRNIP